MATVPSAQFFWSPISKLETIGHTVRTNLDDVIQNPVERVAILKPRNRLPSSLSQHRKFTYLRCVWNSGHLNIVLRTVVRVVRKGSCCSSDGPDPEKATRCSEAPDEDALILCLERIIIRLIR
jgi:hypothetical protein